MILMTLKRSSSRYAQHYMETLFDQQLLGMLLHSVSVCTLSIVTVWDCLVFCVTWLVGLGALSMWLFQTSGRPLIIISLDLGCEGGRGGITTRYKHYQIKPLPNTIVRCNCDHNNILYHYHKLQSLGNALAIDNR